MLSSFDAKLKSIREDHISGSSELVFKVIKVLENEIKHNDLWLKLLENELLNEIKKIVAINEEMIVFRNIALEFMDRYSSGEKLTSIPTLILKNLKEKEEKTTENIANVLEKVSSVITLSRSGTLIKALKRLAHNSDELPRMFILESRPKLEGQLLAKELLSYGYNVVYSYDFALKMMIERFNPDIAVIGADTILRNGDVINKTGSYILSLLAKEAKIPFFVASTSTKIAFSHINLQKSKAPDTDLWPDIVPSNLHIFNYYFETIPRSNISHYITEKGCKKIIENLTKKEKSKWLVEIYM